MNNPWKFAAGYLDSSTGLYTFGERYYDPTLGRWTQLDSAGTGYVYANDNPVNEVDPSGRAAIGDCGEAIFVLVNTGFGIAEGGLQLLSTLGPIVDVFGTIAWSGGSLSGELPFGGPPKCCKRSVR
ncbi:MAG: RHS repeat-associated core domain-containing protein [Ktedonobacteraceae bacterium]